MRYNNRNKNKRNFKITLVVVVLVTTIGGMVYLSRDIEPAQRDVVKQIKVGLPAE